MKDLNAVGVQCFTNDRGKAMDGSEYMPLYDAMAEYDRPIWVHPTRGPNFPDYLTEDVSQYEIWWTVGWPYETSTFMARLVFAKLFDRLPNLKIITHQGGAMIPFFEGRVGPGWDQLGKRTSSVDYTVLLQELQKRPPRLFPDVLCGHGRVRFGFSDTLLPRLLWRGSRLVCLRRAFRSGRRTDVYPRNDPHSRCTRNIRRRPRENL